MCGIAGHLAFPRADPGIVRTMTGDALPSGSRRDGSVPPGPVALGHTRLAMIHLETGEQPKFNEDGQVAVVFNGKILQLPRAPSRPFVPTSVLLGFGHRSSRPLVRRAGRQDGREARRHVFVRRWDARRERLFAARDRFGEKPFLYLDGARGFFFASELKAFEAAGLCRGDLDRSALSDYLRLLYIPAPRTIWKDVKKLPAGHALTVGRRGTIVSPYWRSPRPGTHLKPTLSSERLQAELRRSVTTRLRSDVPMGALLSGGVDSSTVVALMAAELGPGVKTFSVGFGRDDDELPFARLVANRYRTDHHEIVLQADLAAQVNDAFQAYGEPMGELGRSHRGDFQRDCEVGEGRADGRRRRRAFRRLWPI